MYHCCSLFYSCTSPNSCTPLHATLICVSWKLLFLHSLGIKKLLDDRESKSCHQSNRSIQLNFRWQHSKTSLTAPTRHPYMLALLIRPKCAEPNKRGFYINASHFTSHITHQKFFFCFFARITSTGHSNLSSVTILRFLLREPGGWWEVEISRGNWRQVTKHLKVFVFFSGMRRQEKQINKETKKTSSLGRLGSIS